MIEFFFTWN